MKENKRSKKFQNEQMRKKSFFWEEKCFFLKKNSKKIQKKVREVKEVKGVKEVKNKNAKYSKELIE